MWSCQTPALQVVSQRRTHKLQIWECLGCAKSCKRQLDGNGFFSIAQRASQRTGISSGASPVSPHSEGASKCVFGVASLHICVRTFVTLLSCCIWLFARRWSSSAWRTQPAEKLSRNVWHPDVGFDGCWMVAMKKALRHSELVCGVCGYFSLIYGIMINHTSWRYFVFIVSLVCWSCLVHSTSCSMHSSLTHTGNKEGMHPFTDISFQGALMKGGICILIKLIQEPNE